MLSTLRTIIQQVNAAGDLDQTFEIIVKQVCQAMETDICSIYQLSENKNHLNLVASQGLKTNIIGKAKLTIEQGIVGYVCRKEEYVNTDDAREHKAFYLIPDSGEDEALAFLGVPLLHHRQVLGVLVVQQFSKRKFSEDDVSFLITLSAQLAGIILNAGAIANIKTTKQNRPATSFRAVSAVPGIAIAKGWVVTPPGLLEKIPDRPCKDVAQEITLFRAALSQSRKEIRNLRKNLSNELPKQQLALFDAYEKILGHNSLGRKVENVIKRKQIWAPAALRHIIELDVNQFYQMDDPYLQERATDVLDLGRRVLSHLQEDQKKRRNYTKKIILISDQVTSAMIAEIPPRLLKGVISINGSSTSHAAIIARSMGIPALMGIRDCPQEALENKTLIIDGYSKKLVVSPKRITVNDYRERQEKEQQLFGKLTKSGSKKVHTKTKDGVKIQLLLNASPILNHKLDNEISVDGVGLYRSEYLFMQSDSFPGEQEQYEMYQSLLDAYPNKPVVLRTLDIGGDKSLNYFPIDEDNPFLGWRGIRISLDHPEIFITQLRAMLMANIDNGNLHISLPMISTVWEVDRCLTLIQQAYDEIRTEQKLTKKRFPFPKVGAVIEVPSAVYQIRSIVDRVDFISIGSNDLTQYLFAVDRNNTRVSYLYNSLHPATLLAFTEICEAAKNAETPVHICGEIAGNPLATIILLAVGVNALSMSIQSIPKVRQIIRQFNMSEASKILSKALACESSYQVEAYLTKELKAHGLFELLDPGSTG